MQRQRSRYAPGTWQALVLKQLSSTEANGRSVMAHSESSQALPFLLPLLRSDHRLVRREILTTLIGIPIGYALITLLCTMSGYSNPSSSFVVSMFLVMTWNLRTPAEKRYPRWRNALQATFFHLERSTISERLPVLLEITRWLHERPRLVTLETRQQFYRLLTETLSKTDTGVLETLEPEGIAHLIALVVRSRKEMPDTLLAAVILVLAQLQPESIPLRPRLHQLTYDSSPRIREAVEEFYRVPK
ncbi:hypothetical protein [Armatimonas sp.]|uniref:hypothetical protein n=1 Tax=Armatimonas sp. TaxID=1872638 RepID=UPI00286A5CC1|nr:hypothetical protein [Armatimonas sp.]